MVSFDVSDIENTYLRPCYCQTEDEVIERSYCYIEGTKRDENLSDTQTELSENVWYEVKPPRLFGKDINPYVTARQIYITRINLEGKRTQIVDKDEDENKDSKVMVSMNMKKSAVRFLSDMHLQ